MEDHRSRLDLIEDHPEDLVEVEEAEIETAEGEGPILGPVQGPGLQEEDHAIHGASPTVAADPVIVAAVQSHNNRKEADPSPMTEMEMGRMHRIESYKIWVQKSYKGSQQESSSWSFEKVFNLLVYSIFMYYSSLLPFILEFS